MVYMNKFRLLDDWIENSLDDQIGIGLSDKIVDG